MKFKGDFKGGGSKNNCEGDNDSGSRGSLRETSMGTPNGTWRGTFLIL